MRILDVEDKNSFKHCENPLKVQWTTINNKMQVWQRLNQECLKTSNTSLWPITLQCLCKRKLWFWTLPQNQHFSSCEFDYYFNIFTTGYFLIMITADSDNVLVCNTKTHTPDRNYNIFSSPVPTSTTTSAIMPLSSIALLSSNKVMFFDQDVNKLSQYLLVCRPIALLPSISCR